MSVGDRSKTFCPKCDAVIVPGKNNILICRDCDYSSEDEASLENFVIRDETASEDQSRIEVVEDPVDYEGISKDIRDELREQYREAIGNPSD